jgi:hypothetical protein
MHSSNISAIEILVVVEGIKITPLDMELIHPNKGLIKVLTMTRLSILTI